MFTPLNPDKPETTVPFDLRPVDGMKSIRMVSQASTERIWILFLFESRLMVVDLARVVKFPFEIVGDGP
jgi:hypothetical protein